MPGAGCDEKSDVGSARAPVSRQKSEKQRRAPSVPQNAVEVGWRRWERWGGGMVAGEAGPAVLHGRGKWGPSKWQGEGKDCSRQA